MRTLPLLTLLLLAPFMSSGQTLLVLPGSEDPSVLHFNEKFIARNRVASIVGERMVKRDGQPMRTEATRYLYRFDEAGRVIYENNSFGQPGSGRDTASVTFTYGVTGKVNRRSRNDLAGHFAYEIQHDTEGRPVRETYSRIQNLGTDRYNLVPGAVTEISDEHYRYTTLNDTTERKEFVNYLNLPFREQTFTSDHRGYLLSIEDRYLISERRARTAFTYDEKGRLASRIEQADLAKPNIVRRSWSYDLAGNVIGAELWHDDRQKNREEFLYEEETMLLKALLRKDLETGVIHVVRYRTELR